jgi:hypothetical protein
MLKTKAGGRTRAPGETLAARCAAIPGKMKAARSLDVARRELEEIVALAGGNVIVERRGSKGRAGKAGGRGDVLANLWFARAAHEFSAAALEKSAAESNGTAGASRAAADGAAAGHTPHEHVTFAAQVLIPMCKRIVQDFISEEGMDGVRMDDSGMLAAFEAGKRHCEALAAPLRLNALWYTALESTGQALRGAKYLGKSERLLSHKDPAGDHFERLAGRFRRAFFKMYWCEEHDRICPPELRGEPEHGCTPGSARLPDAEELLLMVLPVSPLPRTKQRDVLAQLELRAVGGMGIVLEHSEHGRVESPLHRAWLAQAVFNTADSGEERARAIAIAREMATLWETARSHGLHAFYKDGHGMYKPDGFVTAEVLGTLERFLGAAG